MTAESNVAQRPQTSAETSASLRRLRPGWITIAAKEFADHLLSVRFYVLLVILGIAALIPLYFAAERIRSLASAASGQEAIFIALYSLAPEGASIVSVQSFVGIAAPLLGIAFAFDAVNGERHQGTLPRLHSPPIHREDVINGKFAAGLAAISFALTAMSLFIAGFGLLRLGIAPDQSEIIRLVAWLLLTILYVALWLAFGTLLSVVIRRAATSALVGFGVWLFVAIPLFGPFVVNLLGQIITGGADTPEAAGTQQFLLRLLPTRIYTEASIALLNPTFKTLTAQDYYNPQYAQQMSTLASVDQSFALIIPHVVTLVALTVGCFALAYVRFMRQEVRA
jgi:ABC-2 type transport system permease protein